MENLLLIISLFATLLFGYSYGKYRGYSECLSIVTTVMKEFADDGTEGGAEES